NYGTINSAQPTIPGTFLNGVPTGQQVLNVQRTPEQTFGREDTEFGNMQLIFKGLILERPRLAVSAGLGLGIPTGNNTNITVTDYLGDLRLNNAETQRVRNFQVQNDTWSMSPFVAFLSTPSCRFFTQGFAQLEIPLNSSDVRY